ncbi:acyltransferase family protein [Aestuariivivens sp. NBU2969]|uniref:acyltransferase family protein n=1 Tax=Aestuariivivens sp. NBU2969 TaxID=2873267 RepID=UPI001CBE5E75|nr:DUF5009 domain-containing protein [Aestuariivivens sp. NBU2969]
MKSRLVSLDAIRGFTMFWIIGGDALIHALSAATSLPIIQWMSQQLIHVEWNGFHFLDLIFPMFMFISGVAIPYSIGRNLEQGVGRKVLWKKALKRAVVLILLGVLYNNKLSFDFPNLRYASVLGQIGVAYLIAVSIYLYTGTKGQWLWSIGILLGFWGLMVLIPVPGIGAGVLTPEGNFSGYIDRLLLPGTMFREHYDPQGLLLMVSAAVITISGAIMGGVLKKTKGASVKNVGIMLVSGVLLILVALLWHKVYPINKEIWSSSFNVLTIGLSLVFLAFFYFIIDVKKKSRWAFPLVLIGLNPIFIYLAYRMVDFRFTSEFLLHGLMQVSGSYGSVVLIIGVIMLQLGLLYFLYRQKIFFKV